MNNVVNFMFGSSANYSAIAAKDSNTLYFVDGVIYKGDTPYSEKVEFVSALPDAPMQGRIYVLPDYTAKIYNGVGYNTINVGVVGTIGDTAENDGKVITQAAVKTYVADKLKDFTSSAEMQDAIDAAKEEAVSTADTNADTKIAAAKQELQTEINNKVASVFRFKGAKDTYSEIEALSDMVVGDVWHIAADGKEYVYTGTEWELLGFTVDLSAYATTDEVTAGINKKADELIAEINAYTKAEVDAKIKTVSDALTVHIDDTTIHITADERTAWNAKATTEQVAAAKSEAISTAAADATAKADKALSDAKDYSDTLNTAIDGRMTAAETALTWQTIA